MKKHLKTFRSFSINEAEQLEFDFGPIEPAPRQTGRLGKISFGLALGADSFKGSIIKIMGRMKKYDLSLRVDDFYTSEHVNLSLVGDVQSLRDLIDESVPREDWPEGEDPKDWIESYG